MTRRDFELLSSALYKEFERGAGDSPDWDRGFKDAAEAIADAITKRDPNFDRARFLRDAGIAI